MFQELLQLLLTLRTRGGFTVLLKCPALIAMPRFHCRHSPWNEALLSTYCDLGIVYFRINVDDLILMDLGWNTIRWHKILGVGSEATDLGGNGD